MGGGETAKYAVWNLHNSLIFSIFTINIIKELSKNSTMLELLLLLYILPLLFVVMLLFRLAKWMLRLVFRLTVWLLRRLFIRSQ